MQYKDRPQIQGNVISGVGGCSGYTDNSDENSGLKTTGVSWGQTGDHTPGRKPDMKRSGILPDVYRMFLTTMVGAVALCILATSARAQEKDVLGEAIALCKTGQVAQAITLSKNATGKATYDPNAWIAYGTALVADGQFAEGSKAMFKAAEAMKTANPNMGGVPIQGLDKAIEARAWLFEGMADKIAKAPTPEIAEQVKKGCLFLESCISDIKVAETHFKEALRLAETGGYVDAAKLYKGILDTLPMRPEYKKQTSSPPSPPPAAAPAAASDGGGQYIMERQGDKVIFRPR